MATITIAQARFLGNDSGRATKGMDPGWNSQMIEGTTQAFVQGTLVRWLSGKVAAVTAADSFTQAVGILGFADGAAVGTTSARMTAGIRLIQPGDLYLMNCVGPTTVVTAAADLGALVFLRIATTSLFLTANLDGTPAVTSLHGVIVGHWLAANKGQSDGDVIGDTNGRVVVRIPDQWGLQGRM